MQFSKEKTSSKDSYKKFFRADIALPAFVILLIIYSVFNLTLGRNNIFKYFHNISERNHLISELKQLRKENDKLQQQINAAKKDTFFIEKHAREELGMMKKDDEIFVFIEEKKKEKEEKPKRWIDKVKSLYHNLNR